MKSSQVSKPIIAAVLGLLVFNVFLAFQYSGKYSSLVLISGSLVVVVLALFYKMEVVIDNEFIRLKFGIGLIRKTVPIKSILSVKPVKNSPLIGWGIRFHPKFTLYNASGLHGVELELKDTSRKIRIGTNEPEMMSEFLAKLI